MNDVILYHLKEEDKPIWEEYRGLHDKGLRKQALAKLAELLDRVQVYPEERLRDMAFAICRAHFDENNPQVIQRPLYNGVIFPQLRAGYKQGVPPCARWLAQCSEQFPSFWKDTAHVFEVENPDFWRGDLLSEAVRVDPNDATARELLIRLRENNFQYYIHEISLGLLVEPDDFRRELDEFAALVSTHGMAESYKEAIRIWRFYCDSYQDYLSDRNESGTYGDYLRKTAETLIVRLRDPLWQVSHEAARLLVELGEPAVPALIEELRYPQSEVRRRVAQALGEIGDSSAVEPITKLLDEADDKLVRWSAALALGELGDNSAIPSLMHALVDEDENVIHAASMALAQIGRPAVVPLINAIFHSNYRVRRGAVEALRIIADKRSTEALAAALMDEDNEVRWNAAEGLGAIGGERAVEVLIRALGDEDSDVRAAAASALGEIGDPSALPALERLNEDSGITWQDETVGEVAAAAIARIEKLSTGSAEEKGVYTIPGQKITSLDSFFEIIGEVVNGPGGYFGAGLDSFADCLSGGFGTPEDGYTIRWRNAEASRKALGYEETVRQLERRLATCHPSARQSVMEDLERVRRGEGPTVFDWLVEIIKATEGTRLELD